MSNIIYTNPYYNEDVKKDFLGKYDYIQMFDRIFKKSYYLENSYGYDLGEFTLKQIEDLMFHLNPRTLQSAKNNQSSVSTYISWAIENGYRSDNINPIVSSTPEGWIEQFVDKSILTYFSKEVVDDAVDSCINPQDKVIVQLLFEGVELFEIRRLRKFDVDETNRILKLRDKNDQLVKKIEVSQKCIDIIYAASLQDIYQYRNGQLVNARRSHASVVDSDYVVRPAGTYVKHIDEIASSVIHSRLQMIREMIDNRYFTSKNIYRSGLIYYGYLLWKEEGKPETEDGKLTVSMNQEICRRFAFSKILTNGKYEQYNTHALRQFVTIENIKRIYEDEE